MAAIDFIFHCLPSMMNINICMMARTCASTYYPVYNLRLKCPFLLATAPE
eukprot:CAMPEP_0194666250 /NCGR_PEP_ID=MMETSP0295-20121207/2602_1 /TAXON_ID=39354 /ORGANISM="Heterosigma akashiwo, Strain CCMP2393" /LENGTH=49 /DNA_ID=CAMNT_0039548461 /DNA_START=266 /DNA_END=415 /DNA_ORIENTATION=+